jgi:hypothetical protein
MSAFDYTQIRQTPVNQLGQIRAVPLELIAAYLVRCSPRIRDAITQALSPR